MRRSSLLACTVCLATAVGASAQVVPRVTGFQMRVSSSEITPANPAVTVRITAVFPRADHAFASSALSMIATEPGWSNPRGLFLPPQKPGVVEGPRIRDIVIGQIHFPPILIGNSSNPIDVWEATWSTNEFRPRIVRFETLTTRFDTYFDEVSPATTSRLAGLIEGGSAVRIIPAPATWLAMACLCFAGRRRRATRG